MNLITIAIAIAVLATVYSFIGGISSMISGGEVRHHSSEEWMIMRVAFQLLAVVLLLVAVAVG
jgi:hypothetical protein